MEGPRVYVVGLCACIHYSPYASKKQKQPSPTAYTNQESIKRRLHVVITNYVVFSVDVRKQAKLTRPLSASEIPTTKSSEINISRQPQRTVSVLIRSVFSSIPVGLCNSLGLQIP